MLTALIVEDNKLQQNAIKQILQQAFPEIHFLTASDYQTAIMLMQKNVFRFFLLDIKLSDINQDDGIMLGYYIRQQNLYAHTPILYITSITDRIVEALNNIHCYSYLTKPYSANDLIIAVKELLTSPLLPKTELKLQDTNGVFFKIKFSEIYFFEAERHRLLIYTKLGKHVTRNYSLKKILDMLPHSFIQCHRSYIVNLDLIASYDRTILVIAMNMTPTVSVPVGRAFKADLEKRIEML